MENINLENLANDESPVDDLGVLLVELNSVVVEKVVDIGPENWLWNSEFFAYFVEKLAWIKKSDLKIWL